jgi:hypothetical protein
MVCFISNGHCLSRVGSLDDFDWPYGAVPLVLQFAVSGFTIESRGGNMKKAELTFPEIALIGGTRGMLGAGAALLLADKLNEDQRKAIGWSLLVIGALSTIPLAIDVLSKRHS